MALRKTDKADLRSRYALHVQIGMIFALVVLIAAFRVDFRGTGDLDITMDEQEIVQMEEIQQTQQETKPPPPPRPPVPVEVPNDQILDDEALDLDASLDIDAPLANLPPPPPPPSDRGEVVEEVEPEIFVIVEDMPELIGGLGQLQSRIVYPEIAKKAGVEGRVIVQFVVDENGNVVDPVVVRGIGAGCDEEAVRAVMQAKFTPGKQRGRAVRVKMSLPITFRLK
jgi:periplasmic protein TonB